LRGSSGLASYTYNPILIDGLKGVVGFREIIMADGICGNKATD